MNKLSRIISFFLLIVCLLLAGCATWNDPGIALYSSKLAFGMTAQQAQKSLGKASGEISSDALGVTLHAEIPGPLSESEDALLVFGTFPEGLLRIEYTYSEKDTAAVTEALTKKYGEPEVTMYLAPDGTRWQANVSEDYPVDSEPCEWRWKGSVTLGDEKNTLSILSDPAQSGFAESELDFPDASEPLSEIRLSLTEEGELKVTTDGQYYLWTLAVENWQKEKNSYLTLKDYEQAMLSAANAG